MPDEVTEQLNEAVEAVNEETAETNNQGDGGNEPTGTPEPTEDTTSGGETPEGETESTDAKPETVDEPKAEPIKLKVNGKEIELTQEQMLAAAQKGMSADEKFNEAAEMREKVTNILNDLKKNPLEVAKKLEVDVDSLVGEYVNQRLEFEKMTPEQKRASELEAKLKETEAKLGQFTKSEQQRAQEAEQSKYQEEFAQKINDAMDKVPELPSNPRTAARVAYYMRQGLQNGVDVTPEQAASLVQEDYAQEYSESLAKMEPDQMIKYLGKDAVNKLLKHKAGDVQEPNHQGEPTGEPTQKKKPARQWKSFRELREELASKGFGE